MKLKRLERQLLQFIDGQYSVAWKESDKGEILLIGERQLPTVDIIDSTFYDQKKETLKNSLDSLVGYQCVKKVKLLNRSDIEELTLAVGYTIRTPLTKHGKVTDAFQITQEGKKAIEGFWWSKAKRLFGVWGTKISENYAPMAFALILGNVLASFGIDLSKLLKEFLGR